MPFPSNKMNATRIGFNGKYPMPFMPQLSVVGNVFTTVAGRNMGKAISFGTGIFYVIDFSKKEKKGSSTSKN